MDHPHTAKVFDAGATETGRTYFVMELVRGIKITDYCDQNNLSTEERLKLFTQFCHAMSFFRQGKPSEARHLFIEAATQINPLPADERQLFANEAGPEDIIVWLAYREAKALVQANAQPDPAAPGKKQPMPSLVKP